MAEAAYAHNHVVNPETGLLENPAYPSNFNSDRKLAFIEAFKENGMGFYRTCKAMGLSHDTVNKHYQQDPVFRKLFDQAKLEYGDNLEAVSRINALDPKMYVERFFQLKSLFPEKYADQRQASVSVNISLDDNLVSMLKKRDNILDVTPISGTLEQMPDAQSFESANNRPSDTVPGHNTPENDQ